MSSSLVFQGRSPRRNSHLERERKIEFLSQMIREGSDYKWKSQIEKKVWTDVAKSIIKEHTNGKRTDLSEACFRAYFDKDDLLIAESRILLNEGLFSSLGDMVGGGLAKTFGKAFGGVKSRNWWIFGGGGEKETEKYRKAYVDATEENQAVFAKLGEKTLNNLIKQVKDALPKWPNEGSKQDFLDAMQKFTEYYESIRLATGVPTTAGVKPDPNQPPKLSVDDANDIIRKMRKVMQFYDRELLDKYTVNLENRVRRVPTLAEVLLIEEKDDEDDIGAEGRMTDSMKYLKSNLAPAILGVLGLGTTAAGIFVQSQMFKDLTSKVVKHVKENPGSPEIPAEYVDEVFANVTSDNGGRGLVVFLNKTVPNANLKFSDSPEKLLKVAGQLVGDPTPEGGVKAFQAMHKAGVLGKGTKGTNEAFAELANQIKAGKAPKSITAMLPTFGTGTGKKAGDMLKLNVGEVKQNVMKSAGKAAVEATTETTETKEQSELGKKLTAAGPWEVAIGVGLMVSGAAIKLLRNYGAKNSRSTYIQAAVDLFRDIKPDEVEVTGGGDTGDTGGGGIPVNPPYVPPPVTPGKVSVEIDGKVVKVVAPRDVIQSGGFEIRPTFTVETVPLGDKNKAQKEVLDYLNSVAGKASVPFADGKSAKDLEKLEFSVKDNRVDPSKKKSPYAPGVGTPGVIAIKDHAIRPFISFLFEDADLRIIGSDEAKKSKEIKKLKKDFKANSGNMPLPTDDTVEKKVMNRFLKLKDKDFELKSAPGDKGVQSGLNALRKKLKSGNAILTFSTSTVKKLKTFGVDDDAKRKMILQVYSSDPAAAPDTTEKYNTFIEKNVEPGKREEFAQYLVDLGIAGKVGKLPKGKKPKDTKTKPKDDKPTDSSTTKPKDDAAAKKSKDEKPKKASRKKVNASHVKESADFEADLLMERWLTLAGLLKS